MVEEIVDKPGAGKLDLCGIIMPISGTPTHTAQHWARVKTLLHRAVRGAGLEPLDVWTNSAVDRITTRIVTNIYAVPIAICDISGLNANVMLETGMRLASKRPTIIVADDQVQIPFDIRDFEVVQYPRDTNIIEMEAFLSSLANMVGERLAAFEKGTYESFLGDVTIDVVEPQERQISREQWLERRLDEIDRGLRELGRTRDVVGPRESQPSSSQVFDTDSVRYPFDHGQLHKVYFTTQPTRSTLEQISSLPGVENMSPNMDSANAHTLMIIGNAAEREMVKREIVRVCGEYGLVPVIMGM